ncbi:MAG: HAMP domain-containing protein [Candidatus Latescibacteria bacterium]|nr:HAMP domain-containing protein [Candidatus Latescibacterota bacterium]
MSPVKLRGRLWPRLLLSHISLATIPVLLVGILLIRTTRQSIETAVADGNLEVAKRAGNEIRLYLDQARGIIRQVADNMEMLDATPLERQKLIDNVVVKHEQFREVAVLDVQGREVASTRLDHLSHPPRRLPLPHGHETAISPVFFSDDRLPMVTITVPITQFNQVVGYIAADVNLKDMWDLVDSVKIGGQNRRGQGNAYVVSADGTVIAHPQRERVYRQDNIRQSDVGRALGPDQSGTLLSRNATGEHIAAYATIERLGWVVVVEQPTREAFVRSREMKWDVSLLLAISAAAAAFIGIIFARRIARPISELVRGTQLFAQGQLTHTIPLPGNGELAMLASEFNNMARNILDKEKQLRRAERLATLSKFAAIVSHELRNPLNSMVINLQILKREMAKNGGLSEKKAKYYDIILSEIRRIDKLLENFLTYARPPALCVFDQNVNEILDEVLTIHQAMAEERGITIRKRYEQPVLMASVDANQLKQVFLNLILNAFDAMERGGTLTITSRHQERRPTADLADDAPPTTRRYVTIAVTDTGCGIPDHQLDSIFDVYYTSKSTGTGLGLPVAQQIIEKHSGLIDVQSQPGRGSTFTVWLPALPAGEAAPRRTFPELQGDVSMPR